LKALVTGGGGFIGSHLVDRLLSEGHDVRVLDNFATGKRENLLGVIDQVELVEGDVQSYERAHTAVGDAEVVFHQAALPSVPRSVQDPLTSNATNVTGTLNVLLAARDASVRRVVFASSSSVYGANPELPKREEMATLPIAPYAVAKQAAESYCRSFTHVFGLETVALRYFNVFGPRQDPLSQYSAVIPNFITASLRGTESVIFGDGEQSRDFTYIDNVVEANVCAMNAEGAAGGTFNVAAGERTSLNRLVELVAEITGRPLVPRHESPRPGDVRHSEADVSRAESELGYRPVVSLEEGLRRTIATYDV
jgi:UDP-N-acetylglucosamine/UDP-N-acetyl-alpha-D-glucosaminouronate 4-epimerase